MRTASLSFRAVGCTLLLGCAAGCGDNVTVVFGGGGAGGEASGGGDVGGGGGSPPPPMAPPLRNPVDLEDGKLAYEALIRLGHEPLGATTNTCSECHAINKGQMEYWRDLTNTAAANCFADPDSVETEVGADAALSCWRQDPSNPVSPFSTAKLGIFAGAAHLDWFAFTFDIANGGNGSVQLGEFQNGIGIPAASPWTQADFDIVAEWFLRGLPYLDDFLPDEPGPTDCVANIEPDVAAHVDELKLSGWRAVNAENGLLSFGCAGAATTLDCLSSYPLASATGFGAGWEHLPGATLRVLKTNNYQSSYWTRSSADGRFVAHGGGPNGNSTIVDLSNNQLIEADAAYDPGFFPDNSAFMFQGTPQGTGTCLQSLLVSSPTNVSFFEPECSFGANIGLYQHVGATLGGGDYWTVDGQFVSDNGGHEPTDNLPAFFDVSASVGLTPVINTGSGFDDKSTIYQSTPYEGDTVMSPSGRLLIGRVAGQGFSQVSFRMRKVIATPNGNSYDIETPVIAEYCVVGGKPGISFDERWAVLHRYVTADDAEELGFVSAADPGFAGYLSQGAANLYLLDLKTSLVRRITHMQPGQYAFSPHFRSDGWIYFMVRNAGSNTEHIVASDAALTLESP